MLLIGGGRRHSLSYSCRLRRRRRKSAKVGEKKNRTRTRKGAAAGACVCVCVFIRCCRSFWPSALKGFPYIEMQLLPFIPKRAFFRRSSAIIPIHLECAMQQQKKKKKKMAKTKQNEKERAVLGVTLFILVCGFFFISFFLSLTVKSVQNCTGLSLDCSASPPPPPPLSLLALTLTTTVREILLPNISKILRATFSTVYPQ